MTRTKGRVPTWTESTDAKARNDRVSIAMSWLHQMHLDTLYKWSPSVIESHVL